MDDDRLRPPLYDEGKGSDLCVVELNEEDLDDVAPFPIDRQIVQSLLDNAPNYLLSWVHYPQEIPTYCMI